MYEGFAILTFVQTHIVENKKNLSFFKFSSNQVASLSEVITNIHEIFAKYFTTTLNFKRPRAFKARPLLSLTFHLHLFFSHVCCLRFINTFSKMLYSSIVCFPIFKNQLSKCQLVSFFLIFTLQRFSSKDLTCSLLMLLTLKVFL